MSQDKNKGCSSRTIMQYRQDLASGKYHRVNLFKRIGSITPTNPEAKSAFAAIDRLAANYVSKAVLK